MGVLVVDACSFVQSCPCKYSTKKFCLASSAARPQSHRAERQPPCLWCGCGRALSGQPLSGCIPGWHPRRTGVRRPALWQRTACTNGAVQCVHAGALAAHLAQIHKGAPCGGLSAARHATPPVSVWG